MSLVFTLVSLVFLSIRDFSSTLGAQGIRMVPQHRVELWTFGLRIRRSTN